MENDTTFQIKFPVLEASDALRAVLDNGEHKYYILPIIFLRLLCPYLENFSHYNSHFNDHVNEENSPKIKSLLNNIYDLFQKNFSSDIGFFINDTLKRVETLFAESLYQVFRGTDFCSNRLGNFEQRENILGKILQSFARPPFNFDSNIFRSTSLDEIFNDSVAILASHSRHSGEYVTPPEIATLIGRLVATGESRSYYDPACGSGSLLLACGQEAKLSSSQIVLVGQEKNGAAWAIAKMNLFFSSIDESSVILGNSLRSPPITDEGNLKIFDVAISNPPWNMKDWGIEFVKSDPYLRFDLAASSKFNGDYAFILHMLALLNRSSGRLAVIVSNGTLSKSGGDGEIRRRLIEQNLVEAVISLPQKLFYNTTIAANIFIIRYGRIDEEVFFIDASDKFFPFKNRNQFSKPAIDQITDFYAQKHESDGFSRSVKFNEIQKNDFDLSVSRYVLKAQTEEYINLIELRTRRREIEQELNELNGLLEQALRETERNSG